MSLPPDHEAREAAARLVNFIQVATPVEPALIRALDRCVRALDIERKRQRIIDRLQRLSPEDVTAVDALVSQLERNRDAVA